MARSRAWRSAGARRAGMVLGGLMWTGIAAAHPPTEPLKPGHPTGHVDKPPGMTWPPQPPGITAVHDRSDYSEQSRRKLERERQYADLEGRFGAVDVLRPLLGRRMTRLSIESIVEKTPSARIERRFHYFDRQANATVTVVQRRDGGYERLTTPAAQYQPEITAEEGDEAIALARNFFARRGLARVQVLQGYAIQAYPPDGPGFYDGRVLYVSLHANGDSPPEYVAWVDLTRQSIVAARQEQPR